MLKPSQIGNYDVEALLAYIWGHYSALLSQIYQFYMGDMANNLRTHVHTCQETVFVV